MYLALEYMGGDADIYIHKTIEIVGVKFSTYKEQLEDINDKILIYKTLRGIIDMDHMRSNITKAIRQKYNGVLSKFGQDITDAYNEVPNDPTGGDGDYKCSISCIRLIGYDQDGNKHEANIK